MNYSSYSVADFLNDESFQNYVLHSSEQSQTFWLEWLKNNPHKRNEFVEAVEVLQSFSFKTLPIDFKSYNEDFKDVQKRLDIYKPKIEEYKRNKLHRRLKIAASVIIVLAFSGLMTRRFAQFEPDQIKEITYFKKSTPKGVKSTVMLPDGSKVKLNAESELQYDEDYEAGERKVYLIGEAFFEVAENKEKPFTVYSGDISTTALGTSFNIKAYPEENSVEVFLVTGKVKVAHTLKTNGFVLHPNQGMSYDKAAQRLTQINLDYNEVLSWKSGTLQFNKSNFNEVIRKLERWYNVEFEINGAPKDSWSLTGEFNNESLENVLKGIGHTTQYNFEINENKVIMNF